MLSDFSVSLSEKESFQDFTRIPGQLLPLNQTLTTANQHERSEFFNSIIYYCNSCWKLSPVQTGMQVGDTQITR